VILNKTLKVSASKNQIQRMPVRQWGTVSCVAIIGLLTVLPIWLVRYPLIVDYPNHLARWFMLAHIHDPQYQFGQFFTPDWKPYPYILLDVLAVGLQHLMNVHVVGRLILTFCVLSVPAAAWYFLRRANPGNEYLALWAVVITYNPSFLAGSIQNQISLAICLLALGLWIDYLSRPGIAKWFVISILFTITYLAHLIGFAMAGIIVTLFANLSHKPFRMILISWLMFVPGFILYFYSRTPLAKAPASSLGFGTLHAKLFGLAYPLRGFSKPLDVFTLAILLVCILIVVSKDRGLRLNFPWLVTALLLLVLYFVTPGQFGRGTYMDLRILLFAFVVALASYQISSLKRVVIFAALVLILVRSVEVTYHFISEQAYLRKLDAAQMVVPAQSRILPIQPRWEGDRAVVLRPYIHMYAYGVIDKGWLAPSLFHIPGVQPIRLDPSIYRPSEMSLIESEPDWNEVQRDYDFVWAYNLPLYTSKLESIASLVYAEGPLRVFKLNRRDRLTEPDERLTSGVKGNSDPSEGGIGRVGSPGRMRVHSSSHRAL
jgi:hypothetical protein